MADVGATVVVAGATIGTILFSFLILPEILERRGYDSRSKTVRAAVWLSFLAIVFVPAALVGYISAVTNPVDWILFAGFLTIAILWDYYRLNPEKVPWSRSR